jgi:choline dehydrogenase-like flavoprotein
MFIDARTVPDGTVLETDLCIVGAGAAGITLARTLAASHLSVTVLESGDITYDQATQELDAGANLGLPYFPLDTSRLRYFGGTTNHWGGLCRPMDPQDFEARSWLANSGWPIDRSDLDPYYDDARKIVGLSSGTWDLGEWLDEDAHRPLPLEGGRAFTRIVQVVPTAQRSFGRRYHDELEKLQNVTVQLRANALEIETRGSATNATTTGIRVATLAGNAFTVSARAYVVAAGGLENARLLLASAGANPAGVGNDHDLVGRFFLEHPRFVAGMFLPASRALSLDFYVHHRIGSTTLQGYIALPREIQERERLTDVQVLVVPELDPSFKEAVDADVIDEVREVAQIAAKGRLDRLAGHVADVVEDLTSWESYLVPGTPLPLPYPELIGELMRRTPADAQALIPDLFGDIAAAAYRKLYGAPVVSALLRTRIDPLPNSDSRLTLGAERDALGMRKPQLTWKLSDLDRHSVRRTMEILGAEIGQAGLGRIQVTFDEAGSEWPSDLAGGWHHMGTTRMSDEPAHGVVDRDCRVHGIDNLFIAGSSVFPTAGSGTPTMTLVALALRLADHLESLLA